MSCGDPARDPTLAPNGVPAGPAGPSLGAQWSAITSFANLCVAARRAARNKRSVRGAARFLERLEPEALALQRELRAETWRPSVPTTFQIHDPKTREITAAPFRDRVVHHALIDPLEARLDAALVPESFACRRGKGMHRALDHARELVRRHSHFLKLDVEACFASIEHAVALETLGLLGLEPQVMRLAACILGGADGRLVKGLPIGNLTSQWFANLVLGRLDRFVLALDGVGGYVRYMDDFVLFADDKTLLRAAHVRVAEFLERELHLRLKTRATILAPVSQGLPYLGWRVYRGTTRLRPVNARRTRRRLKLRAWQLDTGRIGADRYEASVRSVLAHLDHGDTRGLREHLLEIAFVQEHELGSGSTAPTTASTAAAASTTSPRTRARRTATTTRRRTGTRTSVSAPPRHRTARSLRPSRRAVLVMPRSASRAAGLVPAAESTPRELRKVLSVRRPQVLPQP